jgi:hypothetical protein
MSRVARGFGPPEPELESPVSLEILGELYKADEYDLKELLAAFPEEKRMQLALFCYGKAHLRDLALKIAASCDPARLAEVAGTIGEVLAAQSRAGKLSFGDEAPTPEPKQKPKAKISLGGSRRGGL